MHELIAKQDQPPYFPFGFPLNAAIWDEFGLDQTLASAPATRSGTLRAMREFLKRVNERRSSAAFREPGISAGQALSAGLLNDVLRYLFEYYVWEQLPGVLVSGLEWVYQREGRETVELPPPAFVRVFPPLATRLLNVRDEDFIKGGPPKRPHRDAAMREMVLLSLALGNPALRRFWSLFDDGELRRRTPYVHLIVSLEQFLAGQPALDLTSEPLFECLRAPMRHAPDSLEEQLEFIRTRWGHLLPKDLFDQLLLTQGVLREETVERGFGDGVSQVLRFGAGAGADAEGYPEPERFSLDADWMSNVVMIAKSVHVWLDQLSRSHRRHIHRLDQIPDDELDRLARWGFTALWLIGLWERSPASAEIKRRMGNPEAASSAYSLYDYQIAAELGGEEAYASLRERARSRGMRLASDMVPNHMGIYSRWIIEHPDWFLWLDHPPFPNYRYSGPNLSHDARVGLYIEDGYWDHSDAAVVFKRVDHWTGSTRYIYHGNDGTSMPWNDTAQLDYLRADVREAVIQTILHVARQFPIIRFDAAMTLAKKHYQRLWFPRPGEGGAIPSRAEHGMSRAEFDKHMPEEFWREVVDRVAREAPDTLLLAEAFWLMEGYFVRTLGMHRVYNSAFMNMLKMEHNADYRSSVKNVLEFSPEVLKRFVNFMNNPDERTAVEQFGKGDKYIGVATMMVTMPGLPMFGHGQIEGFTEKYGMEYRRAYWDEHVDDDLVRRHEADIFPLMRRRWQFSGVEHFAFYDFHTPHGHVDENVFAYSNRTGGARSLVFYNNAYNTTSGWIRQSTGLNMGRGDEGRITSKSLAESLGLRGDPNIFYLFRDHRGGVEYVRSGHQLCSEGMYVELRGYQAHVFLDWREVVDHDGSWAGLAWDLGGRGARNLERLRRARTLAPVREAFRRAIHKAALESLLKAPARETLPDKIWKPIEGPLTDLVRSLGGMAGVTLEPDEIVAASRDRWDQLRRTAGALATCAQEDSVLTDILTGFGETDNARTRIHAAAAVLAPIGEALLAAQSRPAWTPWLDEWLLLDELAAVYSEFDEDPWHAHQNARLTQLVLAARLQADAGGGLVLPADFWNDALCREFLLANVYEGSWYINREQLERLVLAIALEGCVAGAVPTEATARQQRPSIESVCAWARQILQRAESSGYRLDALIA